MFPDLAAHFTNWRDNQTQRFVQAVLDRPGIRRATKALTSDEGWESLQDYTYGRVDSHSLHVAYPHTYPQPQEQPHRERIAPPHVQRAYQRQQQQRMMQERQRMMQQQSQPVPADPRVVAERIVRVLAMKKGSALEITSIVGSLAQRGVHPQVTRAAIMGARRAGWLKLAGTGKVAATARSVRAGGVPRLDGRRVG